MKILVLGDCASAGTNVLTQEITGIKDATVEVSLTWGGKHLKEMNAWYLKETKNSREKITSVVQLYHMAMDTFDIHPIAHSLPGTVSTSGAALQYNMIQVTGHRVQCSYKQA